MIVAADDVRDFHQRIVDHHYVVVDRHARRADDYGIADDLALELDRAVHDVVKADGALGNMQPDRRMLARSAPFQRFRGIELATLSRIDLRTMPSNRPLPLGFEFLGGAETKVGLAFAQQL